MPALGTAAPFSANGGSKHTNTASDGRRLYVSGGDWTHSATDGTWSMSLMDGSWRRDVGDPVYPTLPAPHALQDGAGFAWCAKRQRFLLWPGVYYPYPQPYDAVAHPAQNYARGMWWFDPATNAYEQDATLFPSWLDGTGCWLGGVYDEATDCIVSFVDDMGAKAVRRWDLSALKRLPDVPLTLANPPKFVAYFMQGKPVQIGRWVYVIGYRTDGTVSSQVPMCFRWNIDTHATEELPPPSVNGPDIRVIEIRPGVSHGKLVWPFVNGPEGEIRGIHVYDPATRTWATDAQVPAFGNFIANSVCSLPDGRVAMSGGVFGRQQTHMWFVEATQ